MPKTLVSHVLFVALLSPVPFAGAATPEGGRSLAPAYRDATLPVEARVDDLLARMTLDEKIAQMAQPEKNSVTPDDVRAFGLGSVLSGGGGAPKSNTTADWAAMVDAFQEAALRSRLGIPLLYGVDAVHGHNNLYGATIFPHNIGYGAADDEALVAQAAELTSKELLATGVNWDFAPTIAVPQDMRWGRTYEGFSGDTERVARLGAAYVRGMQKGRFPLLATAKHFIGDGGTTWGTSRHLTFKIDQGDTRMDEATLRRLFLPPYVAALAAGARSVMATYSSWNGAKVHGSRYLLTDVLKTELGFSGFLVSDWQAVDQLPGDYASDVAAAVNAGIDMVMVPFDWKRFVSTLRMAVDGGAVPPARIDDAARRILRVKFEQGLFEDPRPARTHAHLRGSVGSAEHRAAARAAVRKSIVPLKNAGVLPLDARSFRQGNGLLLVGEGAHDVGLQCGGWTISWQGGRGALQPGRTILDAFRGVLPEGSVDHARGLIDLKGLSLLKKRYATAVVVAAETPYAEGFGDKADLRLPEADARRIAEARALADEVVLVVLSGRPLDLGASLANVDAAVAAWLPGTEGGDGIVDVLTGAFPFSGTLPFAWPGVGGIGFRAHAGGEQRRAAP